MGFHNPPSILAEDSKHKKTSSKPKPSHHTSQRANNASATRQRGSIAGAARMKSRHKRMLTACERCRMKKAKCDGEFPCKRCKDDGLVCIAGIRKNMEYKQLPKGYAEVLENTHYTLIATIHKLYSMVRSSRPWRFDGPDLNNRGHPVVHSIAQKLGCIRPTYDINLPVHSFFPEDEASMAELACQLEEQQPREHGVSSANPAAAAIRNSEDSVYNRADRAVSSGFDHSDIEQNYREMALGSHNALLLSSQSFGSASDFQFSTVPIATDSGTILSTKPSLCSDLSSSCATVSKPRQQQQQHQSPTMKSTSFMQQRSSALNLAMIDQIALHADFGTIQPDILPYADLDVTMGMVDPVSYAGFYNDSMRRQALELERLYCGAIAD